MLMRASDGRVHGHRPVDEAVTVSELVEACLHLVPGAVAGHAFVPCPHRLPWPKCVGEIAPSQAASVSEDDALDHGSGVSERSAFPSRGSWEEVTDEVPLIVAKELKS